MDTPMQMGEHSCRIWALRFDLLGGVYEVDDERPDTQHARQRHLVRKTTFNKQYQYTKSMPTSENVDFIFAFINTSYQSLLYVVVGA